MKVGSRKRRGVEGWGGATVVGVRNRLGEPITTQRWRKKKYNSGGENPASAVRLQERRPCVSCAPPGFLTRSSVSPLLLFDLQFIDFYVLIHLGAENC